MGKKIVVLHSGGLDSTVMWRLAKEDIRNEVTAVYFDIGHDYGGHYIAKQLRLPVGVYYPSNDAYSTPRLILAKKKAGKLLFVEDLVAQGRTHAELYKFMKGFPEVDWHFMPVLVDGKYENNFPMQGLKTDDWIVFPYEKYDKMNEGDRGLFRMKTDVYGVANG